MTVIDVNELLEEVEPEQPCGSDLEYDPAFIELEAAARGKPEQQEGENIIPAEEPNWQVVRDRAHELLSRTKDLRVVSYLARALVETEGLVGLSASLDLARELVGQRWDDVHPRLDPEDDNDPTMRINAIASLSDPDTMLRSIRQAPLVSSQALGRYGLRDVQIATGELSHVDDDDESPRPDMATIDAAFMDCDLEELRGIADAVERCRESIQQLESQLMERVGPAHAPDLSLLSSVCREIDTLLSEKVSSRQGDSTAGDEESDEGGSAPERVSGDITSREDVIRVFDKVCEYYHRHEPSSPVPLLVERAKRLVARDFMEIIRDLAPEGVSQAETIAGGTGGDEDDD